jgi:spermidine synthase
VWVALPTVCFCNVLHRYSQTQGENLIMQFRVQSTLHRCQTKFQQAELLQTEAFGRCLVLDGQMQSSQLDEAM